MHPPKALATGSGVAIVPQWRGGHDRVAALDRRVDAKRRCAEVCTAQRTTRLQIEAVTFARLLWDSALAWPDRRAVSSGTETVTYEALVARASAVTESLVSAGVRPGDRVALLLPHGIEAAAAIYGSVGSGAIFSMISWLSRPRQVEFVLRHTDARVLLTTREWVRQQVRPIETSVPILFVEDVPAVGTVGPLSRSGEDLAQICYTSGSTGAPKGVMITHANLLAGVRTVVDYLGIVADDRIASVLPFSFVYGFNQLNCAVATGASLEVVDTAIAPDIVRGLVAREVSVLAAVPPLWTQLLGVADFARPLPSLRVLTCAGGRLAPDAVRALRAAQPQARLYLMYGLTEVFRSTFLPPEEVDAHPESMGRAVPGSRVHVMRDDGHECANDEVGELVHVGPTVAAGYWSDPEGTARVFRDPPVLGAGSSGPARAVFSGDLVRRDATGRLFYVGRRDRMIKTLGFRVSPDEITDVIHASRLVDDAAVTSEPDPQRGERIVAHVVLRGTGSLEALRKWCGAELPRHLVPARWDVRNELPRTSSGKHDLVGLSGP